MQKIKIIQKNKEQDEEVAELYAMLHKMTAKNQIEYEPWKKK